MGRNGNVRLSLGMLLPDLVAHPEGVEGPEGILPRREREPRRPQRRRRLQDQAPHPSPAA